MSFGLTVRLSLSHTAASVAISDWSHLSDPDKGEYTYLFNFNRDISTENKNDMGEIKALVLARGDKVANYKDILGVDGKTYDDTTGMSVMLRAEAQMDQLFHGIATAINDILCPNTEASNYITGLTGNGSVTMTDADGNTYTVTANTLLGRSFTRTGIENSAS